MKWIANTIITIAAAGLLALGGYLNFNDRTASATSALGFGFLLVVLLLLAKFKRFKGYGFEAEMWEEKQAEAAKLVERLSTLSDAVAQQVALFASKLGLWDSALTFPQMDALLDDLTAVMPKTSRSRREAILAPLYSRIERDYWAAAQRSLQAALLAQDSRKSAPMGAGLVEDQKTAITLAQDLQNDRASFGQLTIDQFAAKKSLAPLISFAQNAASLTAIRAKIVPLLEEMELDLKQFVAKRTFRRVEDFTPLYQTEAYGVGR